MINVIIQRFVESRAKVTRETQHRIKEYAENQAASTNTEDSIEACQNRAKNLIFHI